MEITRYEKPFLALSIDNFIPSLSLVRAAAESFNSIPDDNWVKYSETSGQIQYCSKLGRENIPIPALMILDYVSINFDPDAAFNNITSNSFPDTSHYGGGVMLTPNSNEEGGYLGMHVDAAVHGKNNRWKREYSAVLCISEEYDSSFDLRVHNGKEHAVIPYKFNRLNVFKCSSNSWHGFPEITKGLNRKTLGVMYWSIMTDKDRKNSFKAKFNDSLVF